MTDEHTKTASLCRNNRNARCLAMATLAALTLATGSQAQIVAEEGGGERINFAGKLQMLSQRIGAAACYNHRKIDSGATFIQLITASSEFTLILDALENGSDQLDIFGAETEPLVLEEVAALSAIWEPMRATIDEIVAHGSSDAQIKLIGQESGPLFEKSKDVVTEVSIEYASPTSLLQADAIVIGIAGRQRSLAQNISMNSCLIASGLADDSVVEAFQAAMERYEVSALALSNGMPEAGINPTDNPEILIGLDIAMQDWLRVKPALETIAAGSSADDATLADIFKTMNGLTSQMNSVVGDYTMDSKLNL